MPHEKEKSQAVNKPELVSQLPIRTRRSKNSLSRTPRRESLAPGEIFFGRDGTKEL